MYTPDQRANNIVKSMEEVTTLYKYGFYFDGVPYGWKNKKLYRLPHISNNKSFGIKEISFYCFRSTLVCNIRRKKMTLNKLKRLTVEINITVKNLTEKTCPF